MKITPGRIGQWASSETEGREREIQNEDEDPDEFVNAFREGRRLYVQMQFVLRYLLGGPPKSNNCCVIAPLRNPDSYIAQSASSLSSRVNWPQWLSRADSLTNILRGA